MPQATPEKKGSSVRASGEKKGCCSETTNGKAVWVQHSYHDRSQEPPPSHHLNPSEFKPSFPVKLHAILDKLDEDGHSKLISWQPHGRCFVIHAPREFTATVLPVYFDGLSKLTSFQRQLNLYGFKRITQGRDKGGYYHEYFLKDKLYLAYKIPRQKVKGTGVRGKPNPDQEPDLWALPWATGGDKCGKDTRKITQTEPRGKQPEKLVISSSCSSLLDPIHCNSSKTCPSVSSTTKSLQELLFHYTQRQFKVEPVKVQECAPKPARPDSAPLDDPSVFTPLPLPPRLLASAPSSTAGPASARAPQIHEFDPVVPAFSNWMLPQQGASMDSNMSIEDYIFSLEEDLQLPPHPPVSSQPPKADAAPSALLTCDASFSALTDPLLFYLDDAILSGGGDDVAL